MTAICVMSLHRASSVAGMVRHHVSSVTCTEPQLELVHYIVAAENYRFKIIHVINRRKP